MGHIKELWGKERELIEKAMDEITSEYNEILSLEGYFDHLQDYFDTAHLEAFEAIIVEYQDELIWNMEQEQERHNAKFKKAMAAGGLMFLDEMDSCSSDLLSKLSEAAKDDK